MSEQTPDPLVLAYLAGVIDSDGYITIMRQQRTAGRVFHVARIGIAGTRSVPHELAATTFGGRVYCYPNRSNRPQYQWHRVSHDAAAIITVLIPHLRLKLPQAELALRLHEHVQSRGRTPEAIAEREIMHRQMRDGLNEWRRGKQDSGRYPGTPGPPELEAFKQFPVPAAVR